jgi:ribosomal protein L22
MMTKAQQAAVERLRLSVKTLRAIADNTADWQDAEAIHFEADRIAEQIEALELDSQPECEDHPALDLAA